MGYSISQAAQKSNLSCYTLRYYDKEGLLPFVERGQSGYREFSDQDLEWLALINCLKNTGMPIKQIKEIIDLTVEGDQTLLQRQQMFVEHRKNVLAQITALQKYLTKIDCKINYYGKAYQTYLEGETAPLSICK
jgi:DNA-binding transcriptional MerR regulator